MVLLPLPVTSVTGVAAAVPWTLNASVPLPPFNVSAVTLA